jgi:hypothetical protein
MLSLEQQAHVLSLHDTVVEIKATLNNGAGRDCWAEEGDSDLR